MPQPLDPVFDFLPLVTLGCLGVVGLPRAASMYRRGVPVVVIDRHRSVGEMILDSAVVAAFLFWIYLIIAYAWPPEPMWMPYWLKLQLFDSAEVKWLGAGLLVAGTAIYSLGVQAMGDSWRLGLERRDGRNESANRSSETLVTGGIFRWSRNPIYLAFDLVACGSLAIHGRVAFLAAATLVILLLHVQILREERFLAARHADQFGDYCQRVGRYGLWGRGPTA